MEGLPRTRDSLEKSGKEGDLEVKKDFGKNGALMLLTSVNNWISSSISLTSADFNKRACEDWKAVTDIFKNDFSGVKQHAEYSLQVVVGTVKATKNLMKQNKQKVRLEVSYNNVCVSAMNFVTSLLATVNQDLSTGRTDENFYEKFDARWRDLLTLLIQSILQVDSIVACSMLDVIAEIGNDLYDRIPEADQRRLIIFLLGYADADSEITSVIKSKFGRCLAKMVEFPSLRDDVSFFLDTFWIIQRHISTGENALKISFAWTFGNWTDGLTENYTDTDLECSSRGFVVELLTTALQSTTIPPRGRYSACRACGNVFKWMKIEMLENTEARKLLKAIVAALIGMIGNGLDYKLRWNAAHAVGHALENGIFFLAMNHDVTAPIIKTLGKWAAQSQNYKERTQCVVSLMKAKHRKSYGTQYVYLWERLCLSVSRLPIEYSDNTEKFKIEILLMIFHLVNVIEYEDLETLQNVIGGNHEQLKLLVSECVSDVALERLDEGFSAMEHLNQIGSEENKSCSSSTRQRTLACLADIMNGLYNGRASPDMF